MSIADEQLLTTAIAAAVDAGKTILEVYHTDFSVEHKVDHSPLTLADRRSHEIIASALAPFEIPILSEEGKAVSYDERKAWEILWIVDPLDGTKEFIKRNGEFTVNIALVENRRPVFGVVLVPDKKILYFAGKNMGAYRLADAGLMEGGEVGVGCPGGEDLGRLIARSVKLPDGVASDRGYTIMGSRSHPSQEVRAFVEAKRKTFGNVRFVSAGSALKFCVVAEGGADIYPRLGPTMEWDTAAGQMVVEGAGGRVLRYDTGEPLRYNKQDLTNPWFVVVREGHPPIDFHHRDTQGKEPAG